MSRTSALQFIREYYGKPAYRGGRIEVKNLYGGWTKGTIICGKKFSRKRAQLRVKFDGSEKSSLIDPWFVSRYILK